VKNTTPDTDRRLGIMLGLAYGDALGRPLEFATSQMITKLGSPFRRAVGINTAKNGIVTDDTQMSIAVGRAARTHGRPNPAHLTDQFVREFIRWRNDPKSTDGLRAPGITCLSAVARLRKGEHWTKATDAGSKGNGANMRVAPLALRTDWTWDEMGAAAQLQAAITHGHPTAMAAAHLTAAAVRMLLEGVARPNEQFLDHLIAYAWDQRSVYDAAWLGHLWQTPRHEWRSSIAPVLPSPGKLTWWEDVARGATFTREDIVEAPRPVKPARRPVKSPEQFIERGWDKVIDTLEGIRLVTRDGWIDPCHIGGDGWVAEEALATSLHALLCFKDNPASAVRRAAFTQGDSDSIASITGALAGAAYGLKAFPSHWLGNIEYRGELESLTGDLTRAASR
jgi:ADP-ribosylglycohydrolase